MKRNGLEGVSNSSVNSVRSILFKIPMYRMVELLFYFIPKKNVNPHLAKPLHHTPKNTSPTFPWVCR